MAWSSLNPALSGAPLAAPPVAPVLAIPHIRSATDAGSETASEQQERSGFQRRGLPFAAGEKKTAGKRNAGPAQIEKHAGDRKAGGAVEGISSAPAARSAFTVSVENIAAAAAARSSLRGPSTELDGSFMVIIVDGGRLLIPVTGGMDVAQPPAASEVALAPAAEEAEATDSAAADVSIRPAGESRAGARPAARPPASAALNMNVTALDRIFQDRMLAPHERAKAAGKTSGINSLGHHGYLATVQHARAATYANTSAAFASAAEFRREPGANGSALSPCLATIASAPNPQHRAHAVYKHGAKLSA